MSIYLFLFLIFINFSKVQSKNPSAGFKLRVTKQGLNYANLVASDLLNQEIRLIRIPDTERKIEGGGRFRIKNVQLSNLEDPIYQYSLTPPSTFTWRLREAAVQVQGDWWAKKRLVVLLESTGKVIANASGVDILISAQFGRNHSNAGQPLIASAKCVAHIGAFNIEIQGGIVASLMNIFKNHASQYLKPILEKELCNRAKDFLLNDVNAKLATFPNKAPIYQGLVLDYSLLADPMMTEDYVEVFLKGRITPNSNQSLTAPYKPEPLAKTDDGNRMFYAWASDTIMNDLLYFAHMANMTRYLITKHTPGAGSFLSLRCNESCLGSAISEIPAMFPSTVDTAEALFTTSKAPLVKIRNDRATLNIDGTVDVYAYIPTSNDTKALKKSIAICSIGLEANLSLKVENMRIIGKVNISRFDIRVIQTEIDYFTIMLLESVLPDTATPMLEKFINERFATGFAIPVTRGVTLIRPEIHLLRHTLQVESDVQYVG